MTHSIDPLVNGYRKSEFNIDPIFINRWSSRAFSDEILPEAELLAVLEAARWAPSSRNAQLWRFIVGRGPNKEKFITILNERNRTWAKKASAIIALIAKKTYDHNNSSAITHQFDAGAAWENMALEATRRGLVIHAMAGFDHNKARQDLAIPDNFSIFVMIALGKKGKAEDLPEGLRERDKPNTRLPLEKLIHEGKFDQQKL